MTQMPKNVLFIGEQEHNAMEIGNMIESLGMKVHPEINVDAGIAYVMKDTNNCDVIVVDVHYSDARGLDFIDKLVKIIPPVPVVIIASFPRELELEVIKHGAQEYLRKSDLNLRTLEDAIRKSFYRFKTWPMFAPAFEIQKKKEERLTKRICEIESKQSESIH